MERAEQYNSRNKVKNKVYEVIRNEIAEDKASIKLDEDMRYAKDLDIDSLGSAELMIDFEDIFGINTLTKDARKIRTLKDTVDYIWSQLKER